jgi:hypothetical protein
MILYRLKEEIRIIYRMMRHRPQEDFVSSRGGCSYRLKGEGRGESAGGMGQISVDSPTPSL